MSQAEQDIIAAASLHTGPFRRGLALMLVVLGTLTAGSFFYARDAAGNARDQRARNDRLQISLDALVANQNADDQDARERADQAAKQRDDLAASQAVVAKQQAQLEDFVRNLLSKVPDVALGQALASLPQSSLPDSVKQIIKQRPAPAPTVAPAAPRTPAPTPKPTPTQVPTKAPSPSPSSLVVLPPVLPGLQLCAPPVLTLGC